MGLLKDVFRSPEMVARTLQAVQAREAEEKARLEADKQGIETELGQVRAAAVPLLDTIKRGKGSCKNNRTILAGCVMISGDEK